MFWKQLPDREGRNSGSETDLNRPTLAPYASAVAKHSTRLCNRFRRCLKLASAPTPKWVKYAAQGQIV